MLNIPITTLSPMTISSVTYNSPSPVTYTSATYSTLNNVSTGPSNIMYGTSITNGINYNVYAFGSTAYSYTINYTAPSSTYCYVLAVGGGGGGSSGAGGGGGGGGVVMNPVFIPAGTSTINISIGAGGNGSSTANSGSGVSNGSPTTVQFTSNTSFNITALGGGRGGGSTLGPSPYYPANNGGSGGGGGQGAGPNVTAGNSINNYYNYGNPGYTTLDGNYAGSGGGAGTYSNNTDGGKGIQCFLPGVKDHNISSSTYTSGISVSSLYWGGGGGGSTGSTSYISGNGGIGGGGGGGSTATTGGASAINPGGGGGGGGASGNGGTGGTNSGGGGGGSWNGLGAAGGSGIVIIAFPSATTVTMNQTAVLPSTLLSSNNYNDVITKSSNPLSTAAYQTIKGAFATRLVNYNYFGPIMTLRHSLDTNGTSTQNFYADISGNLGTGYLGTGLSVSSWLTANGANTNYAYVTKWYNQGMDISFCCATQTTPALQPVYMVNGGVINFGNTSAYTIGTTVPSWTANKGNCYLNMPNGAYPINDSSFCYSYTYNNVETPTAMPYGASVNSATVFAGGITAPTLGVDAGNITTWLQSSYYYYSFWNQDYTVSNPTPTFTSSSIITATLNYTSNNGAGVRAAFINGNAATTTSGATMTKVRAQSPYNNGIGAWPINTANPDSARTNNSFFNGQLYDFYIFSTALQTQDRQIIESTPSLYSAVPTFTITLSSITTTNFVATWNAVANASYYIMYINGSIYTGSSTVTSGSTFTPGITGPWDINIYAYNSSNVLLASSYVYGSRYVYTATNTANATGTNSGYNYYAFTTSTNTASTTTGSITLTITNGSVPVNYLIVGGGGGGGAGQGGGGGGGAVTWGSFNVRSSTTINVSVGAGGGVQSNQNARGNPGILSSITFGTPATTYTANGGMGGSSAGQAATAVTSQYGGSAGGSSNTTAISFIASGSTNILFNSSGIANATGEGAGGGGGAGGAGTNGISSPKTGGSGGAGVQYSSLSNYNTAINYYLTSVNAVTSQTPSNKWQFLAAGGGGGANTVPGAGGSNGSGGIGGYVSSVNGGNGTVYGSGAGGASWGSAYQGGAGYQGIVIIAIPVTY